MTATTTTLATPAGGHVRRGPQTAGPRAVLSPSVLVRVAGRPADSAEVLRTPALWSWLDATLAAEDDVAVRGADLAARIEVLVGQLADDPAARRALVTVRRDVHHGRMPKERVRAACAPVLPGDVAVDLDGWLAAVQGLAELRRAGPEVEARSLAAARAAVLPLLGDDAMRSAVLLQSEDLELAMDRYLQHVRAGADGAPGRAGPDKRDRKVERSLVDLLLRSVWKTSPFSTLTSVAVGRLLEDPLQPSLRVGDATPRSTVSVNVAVAARLAGLVRASPDLRAGLRVCVAPGADAAGDLVRFARRRVTATADPDAVVVVDGVHEDLYLIPSGPALRGVATAVQGCASLAELTTVLHRAHPSDAREDVDAFVGHLLRLGFLVLPDLQLDPHAPAPVRGLAATLRSQEHGALRAAGAALEQLVGVAGRYGEAPARQRRDLLREARAAARAAFAAVDGDERLVPRTVLYEDVTLPGRVAVGRATADGIERALAPIAAVVPAFDVNLPRRLVLEGYVRARYGPGGRCEDVLQFCHEFQRDFFGPYAERTARARSLDDDNAWVPHENAFRQPEMVALDEARALAGRLVAEARAAAGPDATTVDLGPSFAERVAAALPDVPAARHGWSWFVQVADRADGPTCVVNSGYSAHHAMWSRFLHALEAGGAPAPEAVREGLARSVPPGAVLAEIRGGQDTSNLNLHPAMTTHEIVCPGDVSRRPEDEQIELGDLVLEDDPTDGVVLRSRRLGRRVIPVYLGFLMPMALPEVQQVLLCFSPTGMAQLDLWAGTRVPVPAEGVARYPRLTVGALVLQRALWKVDAAGFPTRRTDETGAEHLLRVERWRRAHGVPDVVFAQTDGGARAAGADDGAAEPPDGAPRRDPGRTAPTAGRKPLPVDFRSAMTVHALDRLARGAARRLVLTEAFPHPDDLVCRDREGRSWVTELLVETYPEEMP